MNHIKGIPADVYEWLRPMIERMEHHGWGPSAYRISSGDPVYVQFKDKQKWVNKAQSWMQRGDICIGADGVPLYMGLDFDNAAYPVTIFRRVKL